MLGIHVRLDLEKESGKIRICRLDHAERRVTRKRRRRELEEFLEKRLETEVGQRASEEYRRQVSGKQLVMIEWMPCFFQQRDVVLRLVMSIAAEQLAQLA